MDAAGPARPTQVASLPVPANIGAQPSAVRTDLPQAATVKALGASEVVKFDPARSNKASVELDAAVRRAIERHLVIDKKTNSLVLMVTREPSGELVRQIPDEVILRLRAYVRELVEKEAPQNGQHRVETIA